MYNYISITTEDEAIRKLLDSPEMDSYRSRIMDETKKFESISLALQGSIGERYLTCGRKKCRCHKDPEALHGPFYHWTRKVGGKSVGTWLPIEVADFLKEWISMDRKLHEIVSSIEQITREAAEWIHSEFRDARMKK
ncbi:MAG: DUF6788 family protein [Thermoplasmataceae archaeon]